MVVLCLHSGSIPFFFSWLLFTESFPCHSLLKSSVTIWKFDIYSSPDKIRLHNTSFIHTHAPHHLRTHYDNRLPVLSTKWNEQLSVTSHIEIVKTSSLILRIQYMCRRRIKSFTCGKIDERDLHSPILSWEWHENTSRKRNGRDGPDGERVQMSGKGEQWWERPRR